MKEVVSQGDVDAVMMHLAGHPHMSMAVISKPIVHILMLSPRMFSGNLLIA